MPQRPILALLLTLAACHGSTPPAVPLSPAASADADVPILRVEHPLPFDLEPFDSPSKPTFDRLPLRESFVKDHGIRRLVMHEDANTETVRLMDVTVTTLDYDRDGRITHSATVDRGELRTEGVYAYEHGRLVEEVHMFADGSRHTIVPAYDANGRLTRIKRRTPSGRFEDVYDYDEHGRPRAITRQEVGGDVEQRFVYEGDRLKRDVLRLPSGHEIVTDHGYGAEGRPTRWVSHGSANGVDAYELTWSARGWLRTLSFTNAGVPIYRRTFAYDEDGRPLREALESFVPAMGRGSVFRYEYELHDEPPRQAVPTAKSSERTKAELLTATVAAFSGAYAELATVSWESGDEGRFTPSAVTVFIPEAIVRTLSEDDLKARACTVRQALGWGCDCEHVSLGQPVDHAWHSWPDKRVVPLTLHFGLGC